jgi:hypothetical protein
VFSDALKLTFLPKFLTVDVLDSLPLRLASGGPHFFLVRVIKPLPIRDSGARVMVDMPSSRPAIAETIVSHREDLDGEPVAGGVSENDASDDVGGKEDGKGKNLCMATPKCETNSGNYRKMVSHIFGRNKACTSQIPDHCVIIFCRKDYQRLRYHSAGGWVYHQISLVHQQLSMMERWGGVKDWEIELRATQRKEIEKENSTLARFAQPSPNAAAGGCRERYLLPYLGRGKSYSDVRAVLDVIEANVRASPGQELDFPGVEFLPNISAIEHPPKKQREKAGKKKAEKPKVGVGKAEGKKLKGGKPPGRRSRFQGTHKEKRAIGRKEAVDNEAGNFASRASASEKAKVGIAKAEDKKLRGGRPQEQRSRLQGTHKEKREISRYEAVNNEAGVFASQASASSTRIPTQSSKDRLTEEKQLKQDNVPKEKNCSSGGDPSAAPPKRQLEEYFPFVDKKIRDAWRNKKAQELKLESSRSSGTRR